MKVQHEGLLSSKLAVLAVLAMLVASCVPAQDDTGNAPPFAGSIPSAPPSSEKEDHPQQDSTRTAMTCEDRFAALAPSDRTFPVKAASDGLSLPSVAESVAFSIPDRIGNGRRAIDGEQSGIVHVASEGGSCTGTYIGDGWVVTAAHCGFVSKGRTDPTLVRGLKTAKVYFNGLSRNHGRAYSGTMHCHNEFQPKTLTHDIALIRLATNLHDDQAIPLIQLDDVPQADIRIMITAFGFGPEGYIPSPNLGEAGTDVGSGILRQGTMRITGRGGACLSGKSDNHVFCGRTATLDGTPNVGLCKGDSGGPAFVVTQGIRKLAGINSFMAGGNCGETTVLSGFVSVAGYLDWIDRVRRDR